MRTVLRTALVASAALALLGAGGPPDRSQVTGGGQIIVDSSLQGAGDTIAFSAQDEGDDARGQVQYVDREGGTGRGQEVHHGDVECLSVDGNTAVIGGHFRDGGVFEIYVVDNGQDAADDDDLVTVNTMATLDCEQDDDDDDETALARGNARVHDAQ